jgi:hypothetical protein
VHFRKVLKGKFPKQVSEAPKDTRKARIPSMNKKETIFQKKKKKRLANSTSILNSQSLKGAALVFFAGSGCSACSHETLEKGVFFFLLFFLLFFSFP